MTRDKLGLPVYRSQGKKHGATFPTEF